MRGSTDEVGYQSCEMLKRTKEERRMERNCWVHHQQPFKDSLGRAMQYGVGGHVVMSQDVGSGSKDGDRPRGGGWNQQRLTTCIVPTMQGSKGSGYTICQSA